MHSEHVAAWLTSQVREDIYNRNSPLSLLAAGFGALAVRDQDGVIHRVRIVVERIEGSDGAERLGGGGGAMRQAWAGMPRGSGRRIAACVARGGKPRD